MKNSVAFFLTIGLLLFSAPLVPNEAGPPAATYVHGVLRLSIPYDAPRTGKGTLTVEVLDPEDVDVARIVSRAHVSAGQCLWRAELQFAKPMNVEDLVWHRLRYVFTYDEEQAPALQGITSISRILRRPAVHILGQQSYLSGAEAAVRLIVTEKDNETPVTSGHLQIQLIGSGPQAHRLYSGTLNQRGTMQARFRFPDGLVGNYILHYAVDTALGAAEYSQAIRLEDKVSVLLTTEKPIYQPSQTIHVRALALDRAHHLAVAARKLIFELEDSRGNKVFRKITRTDAFGIASAVFGLADEVNLGTYHLLALMEDDDASAQPGKAELALQVERYVLPRFKVALELAGANVKRGYRPGDHVTGTVRANYFFGKPVEGEVAVRAAGMNVEQFEAGASKGRTDRDGVYRFDLRLPDYFTGNSSNRGTARVQVEATVQDTAGHSESHVELVTVSESPLLVNVIPESGTLVPGLENQLFVLISYPDGTPAQADIRVHVPGDPVETAMTDRGGIAIVPWRGASIRSVRVEARDRDGNHVSVRVPLELRSGSDQVLLRIDRAVFRAGDQIHLQVLSTRQSASAYVDAVKDGQTIGTYDVAIANGRAALDLVATPDMTGTVEFNAYLFGRDGVPTGDHKLIFVQPADELRIETALDKSVYNPGGEARIGFRVTNSHGEGVEAALGLEIVDQAVLALAEKQPGFAKVFFYLEQELLKPRYEIHSINLSDAIATVEPAGSSQRDRAARALFAAADLAGAGGDSVEFGAAQSWDTRAEYAARYQARLRTRIEEVAEGLMKGEPKACDQAAFTAKLWDAHVLDAWGNPLRVEAPLPGSRFFAIRSAGPDGQFHTLDDLVLYRGDRYCVEMGRPDSENIGVRWERHGRQMRGLAAIQGTVLDRAGAAISRATITLVASAGGRVLQSTGADGGFAVEALDAGHFEIQVAALGFNAAKRHFALKPGDRAIFSVVLDIQGATEIVEVAAVATEITTTASSHEAAPATQVRSWFPEALYVAPEIITDRHGRASITIPVADNITTWRMAMLASTKLGSLGSGTSNLKVFQDFFTELDLPVTLTQGDRVSLPVAVYNYSGSNGEVRLRLAADDWFALEDTGAKNLALESGRVGAAQFTIEAKRIGKFKLTLMAEMHGPAARKDIVVREVEVIPNGREKTIAFNGRLENTVEHVVNFPPDAIPDAGKIFVRLYPGPMSQIVEGMDAILRMPSGCFEQTSSATYPNVLALDYMQRTKKLTPEIHAKAEGFIADGYQRLLTFEVPGGGFSWFGQAPANKILTSYGLMEFNEMSKVHEIDRRVIERTQQWLAGQQQPDGSWRPDASFINEGATDRYNTDLLSITAYIALALENTGYHGPAVDRARQFIYIHKKEKLDAYTLAVVANFAAESQIDRALTREAIRQLLDARSEKDDQAWWTAEESGLYCRGTSAAIETTGLAAQALLKSGEASTIARHALNYIAANKDAAGTWGTTQATIMALQALVLSAVKNSASVHGAVDILLNDRPAAQLTITPENADLLHQFVFKAGEPSSGSHSVRIRFAGEGSLAYQVTGRYFVPWTPDSAAEPLSINMSYDRVRLAEDDIATAVATITNYLPRTANMVMVDLGIPPGFDLLSEDLEDYRARSAASQSGRLEKFSLTATQAILYFDAIPPGATVTVRYRLRAKYPICTRTFQSRVYEYYDPEVGSVARPVELEVRPNRKKPAS